LTDLQKQERKDHETLWKKENAILEDLINSYNSISAGIDVILDKQDLSAKPNEKTENIEKEREENDEDHSSS
jgi:hypothetical protein